MIQAGSTRTIQVSFDSVPDDGKLGKFHFQKVIKADPGHYIQSAWVEYSRQRSVTMSMDPPLSQKRVIVHKNPPYEDMTPLLDTQPPASYPNLLTVTFVGNRSPICCCGGSIATGTIHAVINSLSNSQSFSAPNLNPVGTNSLPSSAAEQNYNTDSQDVVIAPKITVVNQTLNKGIETAIKSLSGKPIEPVFQALTKSVLEDEHRQSEHQLFVSGECVPTRNLLFNHEAAQPLKDVFDEFIKSEKKVLLIQASAGSGKTMFTQHVEQELLTSFRGNSEDRIPLRIELSGLVDPVHSAIEEGLANKGLTSAQIQELKQRKVLIILDGVDEARFEGKKLSYTHHLYLTNRLYLWPQAKVIFGVRNEGGSEIEIRPEQFMPYQNESHSSSQRELLQETVLCPFSTQKIANYIKQYVNKGPEEWKQKYAKWVVKNGQEYLDMFEQIRGAKELSAKPFTLRVLVEVLPSIVNEAARKQGGKFDSKALELTEDFVYGEFIDCWFDREKNKLTTQQIPESMREEGVVEWAWSYCKNLAYAMKEQGLSKVVYQRVPSFGAARSSQLDNPWEKYFSHDPEVKLCLRMAPLKRSGPNEYAFLHKYLQDFFSTRYVRDYQEVDR